MKKILTVIFVLALVFAMSVPAFAERSLPRLVDDAAILTDSEETELLAKLDEISERLEFDVVVITLYSLEGRSAESVADDIYDYYGYGMGSRNDGVLLLVSMEYRDWHITTTGYGITALTDAGLEYISDEFLPDLSDGDYYDAFVTYAELCDKFVTSAKDGNVYDVGNMPRGDFNLPLRLGISVLIGIAAGFVVATIFRMQLKSVRPKGSASDYTKAGSLAITEHRDMFLYRNVHKRLKPQNNGGGGSSTHRSSSGVSHGGRGGKF